MSEQPPEQQDRPSEQPDQPSVQGDQHPIRLVVNDDLERSRLTVFFRLLLVIPHIIWLWLRAIVVFFALIIAWFAALITGHCPAGLHNFIAGNLRYSTHVMAYLNLIANPYPKVVSKHGYSIDLEVDPPAPQNRLVTFFRIILAIPAWLVAGVLGQVMQIIAFLGWFVCLALGRMPKGMRDLQAYCLRYSAQTQAYLALLTSRYPSFSGTPVD